MYLLSSFYSQQIGSLILALIPVLGPFPWIILLKQNAMIGRQHNFICTLSERFLMKLNIVKTVNIAAYDLFKNIIKSLLKQVSHILEFYSIFIFPSKIC